MTLLACTRSSDVAPDASPAVAQQAAERVPEVKAAGEKAPPEEPPAPAEPAAAAEVETPPETDTWTTTASNPKKPSRTAHLQAVRAAGHEGVDRVVFEFKGDLPSYAIEYVDSPLRHCASDMEIPLAGDAWLQVRFEPAQAHNEAGEVTVGELRRKPSLPVVLELAQTCDFEGVVTWAIGTSTPSRFRILELTSPTRLVIDLKR